MEFDPRKLAEMMSQAQNAQRQMMEDLARATVDGSAGGGMVRITMNGLFEAQAVKIDPVVIDAKDPTMLEDLVRAAVNDATRRAEEVRADKARALAGGLGLPTNLM
jgi:DNA-binding YbaB/EbfC family protein